MARLKGSTALKRTRSGSVINQSGVKFTRNEIKKFKSKVASANAKLKRFENKLPKNSIRANKLFTLESDYLYRKKSSSLNQFKTRDEFKRYMQSLERMTSRNYEMKRAYIYKENYMKSLSKVYGDYKPDEVRELRKKIYKMDLRKFKNAVEQEEIEDIGFIYWGREDDKFEKIVYAIEKISG